MNENFIKVTWETGKNGNPPTGFGVMAQGGVRGSMMAAAIVARSVVSVMEKQVGREKAKADLLGMIRLVLEQDDKVILSVHPEQREQNRFERRRTGAEQNL